MDTGGTRSLRRIGTAVAVLLIIAAGCSASSTVEPAVDDETAAARPTVAAVEPTGAPAAEPTAEPTPPAPPEVEADPGERPAMRGDALLGISNDGRFAYAGVSNPWSDETPCDSAPRSSLIGLDIEASADGEQVTFDAGLEQVGDIRQLVFGSGSSAALMTSCGPLGDRTELQLRRVDLDDRGRVVAVGDEIRFEPDENESTPWLLRWVDGHHVQVQVVVQDDPDDYLSAMLEVRTISTTDGQVMAVDASHMDVGYDRASLPVVESPQGYVYREADDPNGALGCEGVDVAATIEVDDGSGFGPAMGVDGPTASTVDDLHFGPDGLVAWTSRCEGYATAWVGRVTADGSIVDAHFVDLYSVETPSDPDEYVDYQYYRLTAGGHVVAVGARFDADGSEMPSVTVLRYDLATDPDFIVTANPPIFIDTANPLAATLSGNGSFYVGESRSSSPGCGASTVYAETTTGFVRPFAAETELDTVVDMAVSDARTVTFDDGYSYRTRSVVLATACPAEYDGLRLWFGDENESVHYGVYVQRADAGEVAELLSVRELVSAGENYPDAVYAEVVLLDGTVAEVELIAVPFDG